MLRCGSVRFSDVVNPTVRFGHILCPTVRFGTVFQYHNRRTYGAVRFGFEEGKNPTVRFGAVEPHRTDRKYRTVKNPDIYGVATYSSTHLFVASCDSSCWFFLVQNKKYTLTGSGGLVPRTTTPLPHTAPGPPFPFFFRLFFFHP